MKHLFVVGEKEKHEIEVDHSQWKKKATVRVDGKIRVKKRLPWRGTFCRLKIGEEETHKIELEWGGISPKIRCFVDGCLHSRGAIIPSRLEKPVHAVTILVACVIAAIIFYSIGWCVGAARVIEKYKHSRQEYEKALEDFERMIEEYRENIREALEGAKLPPYVVVENRNVNMVFKASDGTLHRWGVSVEALEASIVQGYFGRETLQYIELEDNETGEIYRVVDLRPFVDEQPFSEVVSGLYNESATDEVFVHEVWYIVTQLATYCSEIEETPRFPLETMIGGGGDCEDMAILIASMLKAAPTEYIVELVYMDMDNPTDSQNVNHVLVWVETLPPSSPKVGEKWRSYKTFIDGTSKTVMCPFTEVDGWYFEV